MQRCIAYVRVSSPKQGEVSLPEQRRIIAEYAARHQITIIEWFEEKKTAAKRGRPTFAKMLAILRKGKASGVVIHKIDRSARNLRDWADLGELIDAGISVHLAGDNLDLQTRGGRLSADIQAVIAADFIRNLREETKKGMYGRLRQGLFPTGAPLGYLNNGKGKVKTIDPIRGPLIRQAFELYATGCYSLLSLRDELIRRGLAGRKGKPVSVNSLSLILNNPFYTGIIRVKATNETYSGIHEPLIPTRLFEAVQSRLHDKTHTKVRRHVFTFRQLVRCGTCGRTIVGELQKGHVYYRCHNGSCPRQAFREEVLDGAACREFDKLHFTDAERNKLRELVGREEQHAGKKRLEARRAIDLRLSQVTDRLMKLTDAYIDETIEKTLFEERKRRLIAEQRELEDRRQEFAQAQGTEGVVLAAILGRADGALLSYTAGLAEERHKLVESMTSNRLVRQNEPYFELSNPYSWVANRSSILLGVPPRSTNRSGFKVPEEDKFAYLEAMLEKLRQWIREHPETLTFRIPCLNVSSEYVPPAEDG
jgi:site-specific DNA recombinase